MSFDPTLAPPALPTRTRFQGMQQILRFNGPFYIVAGVLAIVGVGVLASGFLPRWLALMGWAGLALLVWWVVASIAASWYIYDFSPLMAWRWIADLLGPRKPVRWVNLHAGLDESTPTLRHLLGGVGDVWDFYDPKTMTEPSIEKARREVPEDACAVSVRTDALPADVGAIQSAFLLFAAHEIRSQAERDTFWREISRILAVNGCVVVAEHLRDTTNFIAFGPGFFHFLPRREWLRLFAHAGLTLEREWAITPFTRVFVLRKSAP